MHNLGLIADQALTALHENARRLERVVMRMPPGSDRDELVWIVEAMTREADIGRAGISKLSKRAR